ncbi:MAG: hypothetical protein R3F37_19485 [Candidatus Competibacteraceae bacterium]
MAVFLCLPGKPFARWVTRSTPHRLYPLAEDRTEHRPPLGACFRVDRGRGDHQRAAARFTNAKALFDARLGMLPEVAR